MSIQIAVRLPEALVERLDELVRQGADSRAAVVTTALERHFQQLLAERDAQIYRETGDYDDFAKLGRLSSPDLD